MTNRERFLTLLAAQPIARADVILYFAGDGFERAPYVAQLHASGYAPLVVLVSADCRYEYGSRPAGELARKLEELGVPQEAMHVEEVAYNTKEEAGRFFALARERGWKRLILASSPHHIPRALLTSLRAGGDKFVLIPAAAPLERAQVLEQELERIEVYQAKGDVASYEEGIEYLQWKESQL